MFEIFYWCFTAVMLKNTVKIYSGPALRSDVTCMVWICVDIFAMVGITFVWDIEGRKINFVEKDKRHGAEIVCLEFNMTIRYKITVSCFGMKPYLLQFQQEVSLILFDQPC